MARQWSTRVDETPFPYPPADGAEVDFPDAPPLDVPIFRMSNWWLEITCGCGTKHHPLRLMAAMQGWRITLRHAVPMLRCKVCGERPSMVQLVDTPQGEGGRYGAKSRSLRIK